MNSEPINISSDQLDRATAMYDDGLFLQAYRLAETWGPLSSWRGAEAMVLASRLAAHLGGTTLSRWIIRRAWHESPSHHLVCYYNAYKLSESRGPYAAWRWMHELGEPSGNGNGKLKADWYAMLGQLAACLRDFDTADEWLRRAGDILPSDPWIEVCRAGVLQQEDRYADALECSQRALELQPWYYPALASTAHLLTLLDRDSEALQLLGEASKYVESMHLTCQLYALHVELHQYENARTILNHCEKLAPLADRTFRQWLAGQRSDMSYHLGDIPSAIDYAEQSGRGFHESIATRLKDPAHAEARTCTLPVGFVRQHRMTCAPATLSAISRFWSQPADHLQVAEEICYNGTTAYNERKWAETNGWFAREFTVTESCASALLDRGVPFTLTTVEPTSAHLQAVIGHDARRGTFWLRDPFLRNAREVIVDKTLEQYRAYGPRGMALVPVGEKSRIEDLDLLDAPLWDRLHELDAALIAHQRDKAADIYKAICVLADGHWLSRMARLRLALYDVNPVERLAALEQLLQSSPEDFCLQLHHLTCLRDLTRRDTRMTIYQQLCEKRNVPPVFLQQYAQELRADARRHREAIALLQRAIRRSPGEAGNYYILASVLWDQRRFKEAFELYRIAACLDDKEEHFVDSYFRAARWFKKTEEALEFLRGRLKRFGNLSNYPARTLVNAYCQCDRMTEALDALKEAMRLRPDDGDLKLFAADIYLACSRENMPTALGLLEDAKKSVPHAAWLQTAARLASQDGRPIDSLTLWQKLAELQPLSMDAHQAIASLLAETQGKEAAILHLANMADRFPHHLPLHQLWLQWVREEPADLREPVLRQSLSMSPHDAWLHRELALFLIEQHRLDEASSEVDIAGELEPQVPACHYTRARLMVAEGKINEAKAAYREAIRLSVDFRCAIDEAINLCSSASERRDLLVFVKEELGRQVIFGDGLLAFRGQAHGTFEPDELLAILRDALKERPDLWHAWSACVQQLLARNLCEEASELAQQATARFPLMPALWLDRAATCQARQDWSGEREALETAYQINPDWGDAIRSLADFHERQGEFQEARRLLEQAAVRQPLDFDNQIMLAELLWRQKDHEVAFERIYSVVERSPGSARAWNDLRNWATALERRQVVVEIARKITERRSGEARSWHILADSLNTPEQREERLQSFDKAIELSPRFIMAHDNRALTLAEAGRWDEAVLACTSSVWQGQPPVELKGRAIWLRAQRGRLRDAIAEMKALLATEPGYYSGWCWLWEWCIAAEDLAGCLEVGDGMVRINPQHEISLGYLGEAYRLNRDYEHAEEMFRRAFDLNPRYQFAGFALFDLHLGNGEIDAAADILSVLQKYDNNSLVLARAVQLTVWQAANAARIARAHFFGKCVQFFGIVSTEQRRFRTAAINLLRQICTSPSDNPWPVAAAVDALISAGWTQFAEEALKESLVIKGAPDEVGRQWIRLSTGHRRWRCGKLLRQLAGQGSIGIEATGTYIDRLVAAKRRWQFRRFLWRNKSWLQKHDRTWGAVGFAMISFGWRSRTARWMADWRQREHLEPWMLLNLVEGLRAVKRDAEAAEASRYALTLPRDHTHDMHCVWLAATAVTEGDIDTARRLISETSQNTLTNAFAFIANVATAVIEMASANPTDKATVFFAVRQKLSQATALYRPFRFSSARRRFYHHSLRLIAKEHGGFAGKVWARLRWLIS
jgi:tetratricopeptide (TPR) repeat protein